MNYPCLLCFGISLVGALALEGGISAIGLREELVLKHSAERSRQLMDVVLSGNAERFVNYTTGAGVWRTQNDATWTSGFVPGTYWYLYGLTGDRRWREAAMKWTEGVRSRATATDNDTGFQIYESFGLGYQFDPSLQGEYGPVLLQAAQTLVTQRYNAQIGCFRSWEEKLSNPTALPFEVNIDQMMNLELILWAGLNGGPAAYVDYAVSHADTTWENHVRADGGTWHVVAFKLDGTVDYKRTHQGWTTDSTWSRGQAWAVYGYTMLYRYTGLPRMLERARICYDYFLEQSLLDGWIIPFSDFDAPLDSRNPRDSSAAAIVASAALELYGITGESVFLEDAEAYLEVLSSPQYLTHGDTFQAILYAASEKWGLGEVGAIFADFYFLEALYRWAGVEPVPAVVTGEWSGYDVLDGRFVDAAGWLGWVSIGLDPWIYNYALERWIYADTASNSPSGGWFHLTRP